MGEKWRCRWIVSVLRAPVLRERGNAESGAVQNTRTSTTARHTSPWRACEPVTLLPGARALAAAAAPSCEWPGAGAALPGARGWGLVVGSKWCWHQSPKRSQTPHCCLVPGVRPSLENWRRLRVSGRAGFYAWGPCLNF